MSQGRRKDKCEITVISLKYRGSSAMRRKCRDFKVEFRIVFVFSLWRKFDINGSIGSMNLWTSWNKNNVKETVSGIRNHQWRVKKYVKSKKERPETQRKQLSCVRKKKWKSGEVNWVRGGKMNENNEWQNHSTFNSGDGETVKKRKETIELY